MASEKKTQFADQGTKGAVLGLIAYLLSKSGMDAQSIALAMPVAMTVLAWASTKIGDPEVASLFAKKKDSAAQ